MTEFVPPGSQIETFTVELLYVPISVGELLDKLVILQIKAARVIDQAKSANIDKERLMLQAIVDERISMSTYSRLFAELRQVNEELWDVEDALRDCERVQDFSDRFVQLARSVYVHNDRRARIKRCINELSGSLIIEEKSYSDCALSTQ